MNWSQSLKLKHGMKMRKNFHCFPIESQIVRQNINLVPIFAFALTFVPVFGNPFLQNYMQSIKALPLIWNYLKFHLSTHEIAPALCHGY